MSNMRYQTKLMQKNGREELNPMKIPFQTTLNSHFFSFSLALPRHQAVGAALFVRGRALFWLRLRGQRVARWNRGSWSLRSL